ncbi:MAG: EscU/YscU/HrcU family type III secretion system export apparatus switch protein [Gammaproteobacteria bacterium]
MAQDKNKKTEKATKRSLKESREKGQVPKSKEIVTAAAILAATLYFYVNWDNILVHLVDIVQSPTQFYSMDFDKAAPAALLYMFTIAMKFIILPLLAVIFFAVIISSIAQFGVIFSFFSITPNLDHINPANAAAQIFSMKSVAETILAFAKITFITVIVTLIIIQTIKSLPAKTEYCDVECYLGLLEIMVARLVMALLPVLIFLAVFDFLLQKHYFLENQKMTKEEAKRHHKDSEGDPLLKGARRSMFFEVVNDDFIERMGQSRMIVTDYTNLAVALSYEPEMELPIILSKGKGAMMKRMIDVAESDNIPVIHDSELALIFDDEGFIDETIPSHAVTKTANLLKQFTPQR